MAKVNVAGAAMNSTLSAVSSTVPTISVTPHSPAGASVTTVKQYSVLEDNLKQLHDIVEAVQHMKDTNISALSVSGQILKIGDQCIRLSCSCPSLNELSSDGEVLGNSVTSSPSHADLSASISTPYISVSSSSVYSKQRESGEWKSTSSRISSLSSGEILRRRSWAALEDLSTQRELDRKISKQRSISLSSLESDVEDLLGENDSCNSVIPDNSNKNVSVAARSNRHSGCANGSIPNNISTHSLNEADLLNDFNKIRLKREEEARLLQARIPLQKSVSTPSILAVATRDTSSSFITNERAAVPVSSAVPNAASFTSSANQRPSGTESETEEDPLVSLLDDHRLNFPCGEVVQRTSIPTYLAEKSVADGTAITNSYSYDDRPEKRRKRGSSLFFRKKKEKSKKSDGSHVWVSVAHGSSNTVLCDWCSKPVETKNARQCEGCLITVHQSLCIQHISATECHQKVKTAAKTLNKNVAQQQQTSSKTLNKKNANINLAIGSSQGNSTIINEEKEDSYFMKNQILGDDHLISCSDEIPLVTQEFLNEEQFGVHDLDTDPYLGLQDEEPDTWTPTVKKDILKKLKEKEIKRQEHMYEFVLTEKHHCLTLVLMQKIFVDGLKKHFQLGANLHRMFPRLSELTEIHLKFLYSLRKKQREAPVIDSISDVLLEQFSGNAATQLQAAYGEFCSRHRDAVDIYKFYLQDSSRFAAFVKHCQNNPMLKKKGIPECILFVTQRLTKYPLLIEPLIKTSENKQEVEKLNKALLLVRNILTEVDSRVAEKEKEDRKLEIYHKIDAKSFTIYRNNKFKKSDILSNNRKMRFEGEAYLMQGRTKQQLVLVIVLSDILFFLVENNNKFSFFTPDGKPGVTCIQKLLVRDKAADPRIIYLISSNPSDPEMFELKIHKPKDKPTWINSIRDAVQKSLEDETQYDDNSYSVMDEEKQKRVYVSQRQMNQIVGILRQKDVEQALIYEEKIALLLKLLSSVGVDIGMDPPSYCHLVSEYLDNDTVRKEVFNTIQKVNQLTSSLYMIGTNLSRSASSVGERQSNAYVSPILPKRAETFGGFDNSISCKGFVVGVGRKLSQQFQKKSSSDIHDTKSHSPSLPSSPVGTPELNSRKLETIKNVSTPTVSITVPALSSQMSSQLELPSLLQLEMEQQSTVVQLTSHIYTLASIIAQQMTSIDSLEAQLAFCRQELNQPNSEKDRKPIYKHNQQLEELRNLQDKLTQEKEQWQREKENEQKDLDEKRKQFLKLQEQIRNEQEDITQQREQLYRKLELLSSQGLLNTNPPLLTSPQSSSGPPASLSLSPPSLLPDFGSPPSSVSISSSSLSPSDSWKRRNDSVRWKQPSTTSANVLPPNLISTTNQQKVASSIVQLKQQIPLKLATKLGSTSTNNGSGGGGNSGSSTNNLPITPPSMPANGSKSQQQQIFPMKLRESNLSSKNVVSSGTAELRRTVVGAANNASGYERLVSESCNTSSSPSHLRTGSSPAMMQNIRVSSPSSQPDDKESTKTNTYPKFPERYRSSLGATNEANPKSCPNVAEDEKVIFF